MVHKMRLVAHERGVDDVLRVGAVEVQVEQVLGVVVRVAPVRLLTGHHLAHVLDHERVLPDRLQRLHAPAAPVERAEDAQLTTRFSNLAEQGGKGSK